MTCPLYLTLIGPCGKAAVKIKALWAALAVTILRLL